MALKSRITARSPCTFCSNGTGGSLAFSATTAGAPRTTPLGSVTPSAWAAGLFTTAAASSMCRRTGCCGAARSSSSRVGMRRSLSWLSCQPPSVRIHSPGFTFAARSRIRARMTSVDDILARIRERAAKVKPGEWILTLGGWHESQLKERRMPTREELDRAAPQHPVLLHMLLAAAVVNSPAAQALGVTDPSGVVRGAPAVVALKAKLPPVPFEQKVQGLRAVMRDFNAMGITSTVEPIGGEMTDRDYEPAFELWRRQQMTVRMGLNIVVRDLEGARRWIQALPGRFGDDWLKILGLGEVVIDQMWDQSVAAQFPIARETLADFQQVVSAATQKGITLHLHATLESTINTMLGVFEELQRQTPLRSLRLVFAHGEHVTPAQLERMKQLGMGLTVQDRQVIQGDIMKRVWGESMVAKPPLQTMYQSGVPMGGGTDGTIVAPNSPFVSLWWMITGRMLRGDVARAREHLTREEALRVYTRGSAWIAHAEGRVGSLEPGKLADLIVLSDDYLTVPEDRIPKIRSVLTIVGGNVVYESQP